MIQAGAVLSDPHTTDRSIHPAYRPDIDGLRAVAVFAVVFFHLFPKWLKGGFVGVDIFFVISGFLISGIIFSNLDANKFSFATFYARRIKRIFPALILILTVTFALGWACVLLASEFKQLGEHMAAGAGFVSNFVLWREAGYFDSAAETKPLLHLWSLGVEEQFYIVWPLFLWIIHKSKFNFLAVTLVVILASFVVNIASVANNSVGAFYSPLSRFWELTLGGSLAYLTVHTPFNLSGTGGGIWRSLGQILGGVSGDQKNRKLADAQAALGLLLIALAIVCTNKGRNFPGWWALRPTVGAYCILAAGQTAWINRKILSHRIFVGIGIISYPLYLWHWPLLVFVRILNGETPSIAARYGIFIASLCLAWLTYHVVERPIRFHWQTKKTVPWLCGLMMLTGLVGLLTYAGNGFDFRYPKTIQALTNVSSDHTKEWRAGTCFLSPEQSSESFTDQCLDPGHRPLVFLWGDSHAAAIYPALHELQTQKAFGLAQYTASGCAPLMGYDPTERPNCQKINAAILERATVARPNTVLLHADWAAYDELSKLEKTVAALRKIGVKRIVLLGPVPQWQDTLPHDILAYWRVSHTPPPLRTKFRLDPNAAAIDENMSKIAQQLHIHYISAYQALCDQEGCLTRTTEDGVDIMSFDNAHLTPGGANKLIGMVQKELFTLTADDAIQTPTHRP